MVRLLALCALGAALLAEAPATQDVSVYGPRTFSAEAGTASFDVPSGVRAPYRMVVFAAGVSSGRVTLNGTEVFGASDFRARNGALRREVTLGSSNSLGVELAKGDSVTLFIVGREEKAH